MDERLTICFLGSGNMAEAIIKGLISAKTVLPSSIIITDHLKARLEHLRNTYDVQVRDSNAEAVGDSDVIFLTVKPHHIAEVSQEAAPELNKAALRGNGGKKLIISIAAGITTDSILRSLRHGGLTSAAIPIVRAMPNIPVTLGEGMTALTAGAGADDSDLRLAEQLFHSVGKTVTLEDEALIDAVTAISGSGPAYFFYFMEALVGAGIKAGLSADKAKALVLQTALGAAAMACGSESELRELRRKVTSPGGTTEAALKVFSASDFSDITARAVEAAAKRSKELSGG